MQGLHEERPHIYAVELSIFEEIVEDQPNGEQNQKYHRVQEPCCKHKEHIKQQFNKPRISEDLTVHKIMDVGLYTYVRISMHRCMVGRMVRDLRKRFHLFTQSQQIDLVNKYSSVFVYLYCSYTMLNCTRKHTYTV